MKTSPADAGAALPRISCPALVIMGTEDPDWADPRAEAEGIVAAIAAVMAGYGLHGDDAIDAIRAFRSALHGFVSLEANGGFGMPVSVDRSFDRLVHALVRAMSTWSTASEPGREAPAR